MPVRSIRSLREVVNTGLGGAVGARPIDGHLRRR